MGFFNWAIGNGVARYPGRIVIAENSLEGLEVTTITKNDTVEAITVSAFLNGLLIYDPDTSVCALSTPTAAQIVAALGDAAVKGTAFKFYLRHAGETTGEDITLTAGSGVTLSPTVQVVAGTEILKTLVLIDHVGNEFDSITITVTDTADINLIEFFAEDGELYAAKGSTIVVGDTFKVGGTGDTTDNALDAAKTSAPAAGDIFQVTSVTTPAVAYVRSDNAAVTVYSLGLSLMTT